MCAVLSGLLLGSSAMTVVPATTYAASNDKQVTIYLTRHGEQKQGGGNLLVVSC